MRGLCPFCHTAEALLGLPPDDLPERRSITGGLARFGGAADPELVVRFYQGETLNPTLRGYAFEVLAIPLDAPLAGQGFPLWRSPHDRPEIALRTRVWRVGASGTLSSWWDPRRGPQLVVRPGLTPTQSEVQPLLDLLYPRSAVGRPRGSGYFADADEFRAAVRRAVEGLRLQGKRPTQEAVARFFGGAPGLPITNARQIREWCKQFGVRWSDLVAD